MDEVKYTVFCLVCGEPMQRESLTAQFICSRECRRYWQMTPEERDDWQEEILQNCVDKGNSGE